MGGLGNQLFQIFTTIAYALEQKQTFGFVYHKTSYGITPRSTYWENLLVSLKKNTHPSLPKEEKIIKVLTNTNCTSVSKIKDRKNSFQVKSHWVANSQWIKSISWKKLPMDLVEILHCIIFCIISVMFSTHITHLTITRLRALLKTPLLEKPLCRKKSRASRLYKEASVWMQMWEHILVRVALHLKLISLVSLLYLLFVDFVQLFICNI